MDSLVTRATKLVERFKGKSSDDQPQSKLLKTLQRSFEKHIPATHVHILKDADKYLLLQRESAEHVERVDRGRHLLEELEKSAPSIAARLEITEDPWKPFVFRLIGKGPSFSSLLALSYCWPENQRADHVRDSDFSKGSSYPLPIDPLLFAALQEQCLNSSEGIWIDQVCIDQHNDIEKAASIAAMPAIYRCARKVIIALSDASITWEEGQWLENHEQLESKHGQESYPKNPSFRQLARKVFSSRWFNRAWCSHEMRLAKSLTFLVPCSSNETQRKSQYLAIDSTTLQKLRRLFIDSDWGIISSSDLALAQAVESAASLSLASRHVISIDAHGEPHEFSNNRKFASDSYISHAYDIFALGAGGNPQLSPDRRLLDANADRTSMVLNALEDGLQLKRSSKYDELEAGVDFSEDALTSILMLLGLVTCDPTALCASGRPLNSQHCFSWINHVSPEDLRYKRSRPLPLMSSTSLNVDISAPLDWIELDCLVFGTPAAPIEACITDADKILTKCLELKSNTERVTRYQPDNEEWVAFSTKSAMARGVLVNTLACIIECDLRWLISVSKRCAPSTHNSLTNKLYVYFRDHISDFKLHWLEHGPWANWSTDEEGWEAVYAIVEFAYWMLSFGTRGTAPKDEQQPKIYDLGGQTAVIFSPSRGEIKPYLPLALSDAGYSVLSRVWLLGPKIMKPVSPETHLYYKTLIFGDLRERDLQELPQAKFKIYGPPEEAII